MNEQGQSDGSRTATRDIPGLAEVRAAPWYASDERAALAPHLARLESFPREHAERQAATWVERLRAEGSREGPLAALLLEYGLSSREGLALMCIAEALLRVPDAATADSLIAGRLGEADWEAHLGQSRDWFVNASTRALMFTGGVIAAEDGAPILRHLIRRLGEPVVRRAVRACVGFLGGRFVYADTMARACSKADSGALFSFDMLGEAAWTEADALRYTKRYAAAIQTLGAKRKRGASVFAADGISVKLSALHPHYTPLEAGRFRDELLPRLTELALAAADADIPFCLDAEEAERLELQFEAFAHLALHPRLAGYEGLGLAIQAYGTRAAAVVDATASLARARGAKLKPRLVKGAYWDTEIKRAQELGLSGYPVFTRKAHTDVSYLSLASRLLAARDVLYPCFATHNAHTAAGVLALAGTASGGWEFQRLHGMGERLHDLLRQEANIGTSRIYAPVGEHQDLVAYLVRRLLENGANSSFVHQISDISLSVAEVVHDPLAASDPVVAGICLPTDLLLPRRNSAGLDTAQRSDRSSLEEAAVSLRRELPLRASACGASSGGAGSGSGGGETRSVWSPADSSLEVGRVDFADAACLRAACAGAYAASTAWRLVPVATRAAMLRAAADTLESDTARLTALLALEAGRCLADGVAEVREAVDFLRYYADEAERLMGAPISLRGPTGEDNRLTAEARGVFLCISPWNFPLALFIGQVAAALASGNAVLAKPSELTPLAAHWACEHLWAAGVPREVLWYLPADGAAAGAALVGDARVAGVAFTGSGETGRWLNRTLAARDGAVAPLIAETGGVNAMVADSSALPEQLVRDVLEGAFRSAGQRCSAVRILYLQEESAESQLRMLCGALAELRLGVPWKASSAIGPVIDGNALEGLRSWSGGLPARGAKLLARARMPEGAAGAEEGTAEGAAGAAEDFADASRGHYFAPEIWSWQGLAPPEREIFGPLLHVATWPSRGFSEVLAAVNASGSGLTFGLHSRCLPRIAEAERKVEAGNLYINRNQIGAVVGVNPFGGRGLSGTGPKAGGPRYLERFTHEKTITTDTTASGGNASLLAMTS